MTAEVAILNKVGVALAADSIVTIKSADGKKTYNTANKLFTLSKYEPVGILLYGATELNTIPWEILIKEYRRYLGSRHFPKLENYVNSFLKFLREKSRIGKEEKDYNVKFLSGAFAQLIRHRFVKSCDNSELDCNDLKDKNVSTLLDEVLNKLNEQFDKSGQAKSLKRTSKKAFRKAYQKTISQTILEVFRGFGLSAGQKRKIYNCVFRGLFSNHEGPLSSGIAVAGYGRDEYFPKLIRIETDGFVGNSLKITLKKDAGIHNIGNRATIVPLAQRDIVDLLMQGVHQEYQEWLDATISELINGIPVIVEDHFSGSKEDFENLRKGLRKVLSELEKKMPERRYDYSRRIIQAVTFLEKDELATLAHSLVSITATVKKISLEMETVGEPIDVAVISKNDGFIWIKRKHYFDPNLNQFFFSNYLRP